MSVSRQRTMIERAPIRIGVVDDDPGVRRALARLLRVSGYETRTFGSAEEFLTLGPPLELDCLVVDVYLSGMNGLDLVAELLSAGRTPPTVFITAHDDAMVATRVLCLDGVVCLRKPFEEDVLLAAIVQAVSGVRP